MLNTNATAARPVNAERANSGETRVIVLSMVHAALLEQLVQREAKRLGEEPESVRRIVELGVLTRGIAAMQEQP